MDESFHLCACMGPLYGEPHCLCEMSRRGLPLNETARTAETARLKEAVSKVLNTDSTFKHELSQPITELKEIQNDDA